MPGPLEGRVALVTGAAGGIGGAISTRLAAAGADLVLVDVSSCAAIEAEVAGLGARTLVSEADVSSEAAIADLAIAVGERFGVCDVLVNNAGRGRLDAFEEISLEAWREVMAVNLEGPFLLARAFVGGMREQRWGRIVNIASNTFGSGQPAGFAHYVASKGGLIGLTRALAREFGGDGITANAVSPGLTRTPATEQRMEKQFAIDRAKQSIPRTGETADLAGAVAFLASEEAAFITGQTLNVDGGFVLS